MKKVLSIVLGVVVILGVGGYFLATGADAATPVDSLYPVDTFFEDLQRIVTLDEVALVELEQSILDEREAELGEVLTMEDIEEADVEDCIDGMDAQRERLYTKLGEAQEKMEQKGNTEAIQALEQVQNKYQEQVQKQIETTTKAQEKYGDVGQEVRENLEIEQNSLSNQGEDTQNQQQNEEENSDNGQGGTSGSSGSGSTGGNGNN
jgi:hypothetical protein